MKFKNNIEGSFEWFEISRDKLDKNTFYELGYIGLNGNGFTHLGIYCTDENSFFNHFDKRPFPSHCKKIILTYPLTTNLY